MNIYPLYRKVFNNIVLSRKIYSYINGGVKYDQLNLDLITRFNLREVLKYKLFRREISFKAIIKSNYYLKVLLQAYKRVPPFIVSNIIKFGEDHNLTLLIQLKISLPEEFFDRIIFTGNITILESLLKQGYQLPRDYPTILYQNTIKKYYPQYVNTTNAYCGSFDRVLNLFIIHKISFTDKTLELIIKSNNQYIVERLIAHHYILSDNVIINGLNRNIQYTRFHVLKSLLKSDKINENIILGLCKNNNYQLLTAIKNYDKKLITEKILNFIIGNANLTTILN